MNCSMIHLKHSFLHSTTLFYLIFTQNNAILFDINSLLPQIRELEIPVHRFLIWECHVKQNNIVIEIGTDLI